MVIPVPAERVSYETKKGGTAEKIRPIDWGGFLILRPEMVFGDGWITFRASFLEVWQGG